MPTARTIRALRSLAALGVLLLGTALPSAASAAALQFALGGVGATSSWDGDGGGGASVGLGYRALPWLGFDAQVTELLFSVDQRINTGLSLGVTVLLPWERARPTLRIFAVHQHEEGLVSVLAQPWGTLFGIGAGIRHRAGGGISLGAEIPLLHRGRWEGCLVARADGIWLPDRSLGPGWYAGGSVGVSVNYATGDQP